MAQVLVVEDDALLRDQVVTYLALSGLEAAGVGSAAELYRRMAVERFTVLVLDLRLPDEDGVTIAAHVRSLSEVGIVMLTARGAIADRIRGRQAGADVYLTKPVDLEELVAAVRNLLRRLPLPGDVVSSPTPGWVLDRPAFGLRAPNGAMVALTPTDMALFTRLVSPVGTVVGRGDLLDALGHDPCDPTNRNLDAAVRRLRTKVRRATGLSLPLRTVHAVGYQFTGDAAIGTATLKEEPPPGRGR